MNRLVEAALRDVALSPELHVHARLELVRAGQVRHSEPLLELAPRNRAGCHVAVGEVERLVLNAVPRVVPPFLARVVLIQGLQRDARLEQDAARRRIGPRHARQVVRVVPVRPGRLGRDPRRPRRQQVEHAVAVVLERARADDLVLLGRLPGDAKADVLRVVVGVRDTARGVRLVEQRRRLLQLVPVHAVDKLLRDAFARRSKEPQAVAFDRTADADPAVAELLERADARRVETALEQVVVDVAHLEVGAGVRERRRPGQRVAAVARNHVDRHAAAVAVGTDAAVSSTTSWMASWLNTTTPCVEFGSCWFMPSMIGCASGPPWTL